MLVIKRVTGIFLLLAGLSLNQVNGQPVNLVLEDTTITTTVTFVATNSITAGAGFTITSTGNVTFNSGGTLTFNSGFTLMTGASFQGFSGSPIGIDEENASIPNDFILQQNYPNPFSTSTEIRYGLPVNDHVTVVIYNLSGQRIKILLSEQQQAGYHTVSWDGRNETGHKMSSGIFCYRIETARNSSTGKMMLE